MSARRRRPRLFSFSRDVEVASFADVVSSPDERELLEAIVDAFIEVCRTHELPPRGLDTFERGARHPAPSVRGIALTRLTVLSHYFPEAGRLLEAVAASDDEELRLFACAVAANGPEDVVMQVLTGALSDPSWRVRKAAAQASGTGQHPGLIEALQRQVAVETDARVRIQLQLALDFQRAGQA